MATAIMQLLQLCSKGSSVAGNELQEANFTMRKERGRRTSRQHGSRRPSAIHDTGDLWSMRRVSRSFDNSLSLEKGEEGEEADGSVFGTPERDIGSRVLSEYARGLKFNDSIRELFVQHLATLFSTYKNFLLNAKKYAEQPAESRESVPTFDKVSFLSEQPGSHLLFLSAFLETQVHSGGCMLCGLTGSFRYSPPSLMPKSSRTVPREQRKRL